MSPPQQRHQRVVVVGAGPCGLAIARQLLHEQRIEPLVLDRATAPASTWRDRYEGFRLNTCGYWSHLPGQPIPRRYGRWPKRDDMVDYFDSYVRRQRIPLSLGVTVTRIDRDGDRWLITTDGDTYTADAVVIATGNYHTPALPAWPGMEGYTGDLLHSADYRNPWPFAGRDVLVVGSGNSATDIALQLSDEVAGRVRLAVREPPHLMPRSAAGIPVDAFSAAFSRLPVPVIDHAAALASRLWFGDLTSVGLPAPRRGIYRALLDDGSIPTLGDELVPQIKAGRIEVVAAVESFEGDSVVLADGRTIRPDVVIGATGYRHGLEPLVGHLDVLDEDGAPLVNGLPPAAPGLWFAGYEEPIIGPLQSFRLQAGPLAAEVAGFAAG
ncbi:flavin-containing monooxygenase [Mycolicibacterium monacense]|uniref:FAD-dependent pyridine nucleotide-disulfide oxidoreductase n=2 Tax=unclassified Mycobacterium TaxID=2642494 RepID=A0A5Q5BSP3_MYCSS|nr:NAD(P)/FAD-dependent oxidoreductase [Mycolicibacterium monacense]OBF56206.1 pyridine nucleotide-disulfide oxidoreductase [Mycolicibacterium monacense]